MTQSPLLPIPEEAVRYANQVYARSRIREPHCSGQLLEPLARFLVRVSGPLEARKPGFASIDAVLKSVDEDGNINETSIRTLPELEDAIAALDCSQRSETKLDHPAVLRLYGHQNPLCLARLGAQYDIDHLLYQHLSYMWLTRHDALHAKSSLPSSSTDTIQLAIFTVGEHREAAESLETLRIRSLKSFSAYRMSLEHTQGLLPGDSIARWQYVHSRQAISIEQRITISLRKRARQSILFIWQDSANPVNNDADGVCQRLTKLPTMRPLSTLRLPRDRRQRQDIASCERGSQSSQQSAHPHSASQVDVLSTVADLFELSAYSICRVLNVVEEAVALNTGYNILSWDGDVQAELLYNQDILTNLHQTTTASLADLRRCRSQWGDEKHKSEDMYLWLDGLETDIQHLIDRIVSLSQRCRDGMSMYMSSTSIIEAKKSILQAEKVTQLTALAFVYIPLSFTTSFFSMNMSSLGADQGLPIWPWFAVSASLLLLSYGVLLGFGNYRRIWKDTKDLVARARKI